MSESFGSQHTNTFPDFLSQMGISLLISTYQAGKLIHLRNDNGVLNTHFYNLEKPMGIALQGPRLAIGSAYQVLDCYNMPDVAPKVEPYNTHDSCYLPRGIHVTGEIDIHEMGFSEEGELWLVNTKMSCLCTLDSKHSVIPKWRPPFISEYDLSDRCHLNGLAMRGGKPAYVSALGTTDSAAGWRQNKASGGILMDVESNRTISTGLSMPHSPRWYQDKLWVLESGDGSLATVDLESGELTKIIELPGFTRGLDFIGRYAIVGLSQIRETAVFAGLPLTKRLDERQCGVYIVDIVDKSIVGFVTFTGDVQEIFSVQILPDKYPVVLDLNDPLLRSSFSMPEDALENLSSPDPVQMQFNEASHLLKEGKVLEARKAFEAFVDDHPDHLDGRFSLGLLYLSVNNWNRAYESISQVIDKDQNNADAYNALGQVLEGRKEWEKSIEAYDQAISIDKQFAVSHVNRALVLLRLGRYKEGWEEFEWRWKITGISALNCSQPEWQGEDISSKTILVHTEQSNRDIVLLSRFITSLSKRCGRVVVLCNEPFRLFFKSIKGIAEVWVDGVTSSNGKFDVYIPLMSLPKTLEYDQGVLSEAIPFCSVLNEVVVSPLRSVQKHKVGLIWRDAQETNNYLEVNSFLKALNINQLEDAELYSLQTSTNSEEIKLLTKCKINNLEADMVSYSHICALLNQLDLLVTVDCALAHLAGSIGLKTLLILDENPRWYLEGRLENCDEQLLWYPETKVVKNIKTIESEIKSILLEN